MGVNSLAWFWDVFVKCIYSDRYTKELACFLKNKKIKRILDCACGTGFPSIDLIENGFDVVCSDSNNEMISSAKKNAEMKNRKIDFFQLDWCELDKKFGEEFDCVLCRGNALAYADSWGKDIVTSEKAYSKIKTALKKFFYVLKPGGILYVDTALKNSFEVSGEVFLQEFKKNISGKDFTVLIAKKNDLNNKISFWNPQILEWNNGSLVSANGFFLKSALLTPFQLKQELISAGFRKIEEVSFKGENFCTVFLAYK
ncbi:MAG: class I SAM-dependent methyltransferase [Candidatus Diapherotrites archaeon]|nr:class I SAM-dependent methyltransferase [Candidatus Diapherotrites archaeon]